MKSFLIQIIGYALALYYLLPEIVHGIHVDGGKTAIIAALTFAFINFAIKPVLKIITLPINLLTFGLFGLLINVLLFWFVASIINGFQVDSFSAAFWGALVMTIVNWILHKIAS